MRLFNKTKNLLIADDIEELKGWKAAKGLIGTKPRSVFFKTRFGIHTFGVLNPIDVLLTNQKNVVVVLKENLRPGSVFFWNPRYNKVYELPQGFLQQSKTQVGDLLEVSG